MRRCYRCKVEKSDDAFIRRIDDRHYGMCRVCLGDIEFTEYEKDSPFPHGNAQNLLPLPKDLAELWVHAPIHRHLFVGV